MEYVIRPKGKFSLGIKELVLYRELFYFFTWRDIKVKYKQAALGFLWAILQPLAMMAIFTLIFSKGMKVSSENIPYPIFALSGLIIWNVFSTGLSNSANSMISNANVVKKIYFPRLIIPISSILAVLFDFCIALVIYLFICFYYRGSIDFVKLLYCIPISVILIVLTTFGMGAFIAALNVKFRDFQYIIPFLIQFLFFANPVLYSSRIFSQKWINVVMTYNPIASAININRAAFVNNELNWVAVLCSFIVASIIFFIGLFTFRKTEAYFADIA